MDKWDHLSGENPSHVVMLLLGETKREYADAHSISHEQMFKGDPEIWTCNAGFRIWQHDVLFVMDDLEQEAHKFPGYGLDLELHDRPIITSRQYPRWPMSREYPYIEVCEKFKLRGMNRYFFNTVPFMLAYALFIGVKKTTIFGADYWHPALPGMREADHANAEWWLGFCAAHGMELELAANSTLMAANQRDRPTYGYRFDPRLTHDRWLKEQAIPETAKRIIAEAEAEHQNEIARWPDLPVEEDDARPKRHNIGTMCDPGIVNHP